MSKKHRVLFRSENGGSYDVRSDGRLFTKSRRGGRGRGKAGEWYQVTGTPYNRGYLSVRIDGKIKPIHRIVAKYFLEDYSEDMNVDHINGNVSDNRASNLRMMTQAQNSRAFNRPTKGASSKHRGVWWHKANKKWIAEIKPDRKKCHIGCFDTEAEAAAAYNDKALEFGFSPEALNKIA